jgi:hypothetical protein
LKYLNNYFISIYILEDLYKVIESIIIDMATDTISTETKNTKYQDIKCDILVSLKLNTEIICDENKIILNDCVSYKYHDGIICEKCLLYFIYDITILIKQIYINIRKDYFVDFAQSQIRQLIIFLTNAQTIKWNELSQFLEYAIEILHKIIIKLINKNNANNNYIIFDNINIQNNNNMDMDIDKLTFKNLWENDILNSIRKLYLEYSKIYNSI